MTTMTTTITMIDRHNSDQGHIITTSTPTPATLHGHEHVSPCPTSSPCPSEPSPSDINTILPRVRNRYRRRNPTPSDSADSVPDPRPVIPEGMYRTKRGSLIYNRIAHLNLPRRTPVLPIRPRRQNQLSSTAGNLQGPEHRSAHSPLVSPAHRRPPPWDLSMGQPGEPPLLEWISNYYPTSVQLDTQNTPESSSSTNNVTPSSLYVPVPATPSRHSLPEPDSILDSDPWLNVEELWKDIPFGVFTYDPAGPPPRTPLWMPASDDEPEPEPELGGSVLTPDRGEGVYPSPPRTPQRVSVR